MMFDGSGLRIDDDYFFLEADCFFYYLIGRLVVRDDCINLVERDRIAQRYVLCFRVVDEEHGFPRDGHEGFLRRHKGVGMLERSAGNAERPGGYERHVCGMLCQKFRRFCHDGFRPVIQHSPDDISLYIFLFRQFNCGHQIRRDD